MEELTSRLKAISLLYKAGYASQEKAAEVADLLLTPKNGEIVLDYAFFCGAPKGIGETLARILPDSKATKLTISDHNPVYGYTHTPIHLLRTNCNRDFGDRLKFDALFGCLNKTKIAELSIADAPFGDAAYAALDRTLSETKTLTAFTARHTDIAEAIRNGAFKARIDGGSLQKLALPDNALSSAEAVAVAEKLGKKGCVSEIDLSENKICSPGIDRFFALLPDAARKLNLNEAALTDRRSVCALAKGLTLAPQLTDLDVSVTELDSRGAADLFAAFPRTGLLRVNLGGNELRDDDGEALAKALSHDDCTIYETRVTEQAVPKRRTFWLTPSNVLSAPVLEKIREAEKKNEAKYGIVLDQEKARATYAAFSEGEKGDPANVFVAAKAGKIAEVLEKRALTPADYAQKDEGGKPLLIHIAESRTLDAVFNETHWNNPKKMQELWDCVPDRFKTQMDGRNGRPSFIRNKNKVMAKTVKTVLNAGRPRR
ncbi:MAG: hypothetical protein ACI4PW_08255 [Alphaproteobacteria bacterium]